MRCASSIWSYIVLTVSILSYVGLWLSEDEESIIVLAGRDSTPVHVFVCVCVYIFVSTSIIASFPGLHPDFLSHSYKIKHGQWPGNEATCIYVHA